MVKLLPGLVIVDYGRVSLLLFSDDVLIATATDPGYLLFGDRWLFGRLFSWAAKLESFWFFLAIADDDYSAAAEAIYALSLMFSSISLCFCC